MLKEDIKLNIIIIISKYQPRFYGPNQPFDKNE